MKRKIVKVLGGILGFVGLFLLYVQLTYKQEFDVPLTGIRSSRDPSVIAWGEQLVMGPAHCWNCHAPDGEKNLQTGTQTGMSGGLPMKIPFGVIYTPNITPDSATGIGNWTDEMLARAIRHNVKHDNTALLPFMSYNGMNDADIAAVISYLRTQPPVRNKVPDNEIDLIGKTVMRFVIEPVPTIRPAILQPDTSAAYGAYLAVSVANCKACHTDRDEGSGAFNKPPFSGGFHMPVGDKLFVTPNLTPDVNTGVLAGWSEADFVKRFRMGAVYPATPMPWKAYQRLSDNDLKALYRFFKSLDPVNNPVRPHVRSATQAKLVVMESDGVPVVAGR